MAPLRNAGPRTGSGGKPGRWSVYSLLSVLPVVVLHLVHGLAAPLLAGAASDRHAHHHGASAGFGIPDALLAAVLAANAVSAYFAVRQLVQAWRDRKRGSVHTYVCCAVSVGVLVIVAYTAVMW